MEKLYRLTETYWVSHALRSVLYRSAIFYDRHRKRIVTGIQLLTEAVFVFSTVLCFFIWKQVFSSVCVTLLNHYEQIIGFFLYVRA